MPETLNSVKSMLYSVQNFTLCIGLLPQSFLTLLALPNVMSASVDQATEAVMRQTAITAEAINITKPCLDLKYINVGNQPIPVAYLGDYHL